MTININALKQQTIQGMNTSQVSQPVQQPQPVAQPQPSPLSGLVSGAKKVLANPAVRWTGAGLGKIAQNLSKPLYSFGGFLRGARSAGTQEVARQQQTGEKDFGKGLSTAWQGGVAGAKRGFSLQEQTSPGTYLTEDVLKMPSDTGRQTLAKTGVGLATDLVADPLNIFTTGIGEKGLGLIGKGISKLGQTAPVQKVLQTARTTPTLYNIIEKFSPYFRNPEVGKMIEATKETQGLKLNQLFRQVDEAAKGLTDAEKVRVGQILEGSITSDPKLATVAQPFRQLADTLGQELVNAGILKPEQFNKYKGQYLPHIWNEMIAQKAGITSTGAKLSDMGYAKLRTGAEGYTKQFMQPVFSGLGKEIKDVEVANLFKSIAQKYGVDAVATPEKIMELSQKGYRMAEDLSKTRGGAVLNKMLLPGEIIDYLNKSKVGQAGDLGKMYDKVMGWWKAGKTIWNPAYHVRNIVSNQILSDMQTGKGLLPTVIDYVGAVRKYFGKGDQRYVIEAVDNGLIKRKAFGEMSAEFLPDVFKNEGKTKQLINKLVSAPQDIQQFSEDTAKLNVFTEFRKQGLSVKEAIAKAQEAIFSPYKIGEAERSIMGRAIPFYSFTRQAAPFTAKTLATHPERLAKYPKFERAFEQLSEKNKPDEKYLPNWQKEMVRTPWKNKEGQTKYFNPQYFYPWGSFLEEPKAFPLNLPLGLSMNPAVGEIAAQATKVDPYFQRPFIKENMTKDQQTKARVGHLANTLLPSMAWRTPVEKVLPALQGRPDYAGRERDIKDILLGDIAALKTYPYDVKAGKTSLMLNKNSIQKETRSKLYSIMLDKSTTPQEKKKLRDEALKRQQERLKELSL